MSLANIGQDEAPELSLRCEWSAEFAYGRPVTDILVSAPCHITTFNVDLQAPFREWYGVNWSGPFGRSFPDLASVTEYLRDLTFPRLLDVLQAEARRSPERVELFGAKIPSDQIARWGTLALFVVQMYLLLDISALVRVSANEPRALAETPWLGTYETSVARLATVMTAAILPIVSAMSLLLAPMQTGRGPATVGAAAILALFVVSVLTTRRLMALWKLQAITNSGHTDTEHGPSDLSV